MKRILKINGAFALAFCFALLNLASCKKDTPIADGNCEISSTGPVYTDNFRYESMDTQKIDLVFLDAKGDTIRIDGLKSSGLRPTGDGCDIYYYMASSAIYGGYFVDNFCFSGTSDPNALGVWWDVDLPADISFVSDPSNYVRIRLGVTGFLSAPSGTGFRDATFTYSLIDTFTSPAPESFPMKKWRFTAVTTPFIGSDYCLNATVNTIFRVMTDCSDLGSVTSGGVVTQSLAALHSVRPCIM